MSAGTLFANVILDDPQMLHCGTDDPVTGHVVIRCSSAGELFGPLIVRIRLHGRAKSKIIKTNGNSRHIYRGRAPLLSTEYVIHDGPFRSDPGAVHQFPFSVRFPGDVQCAPVPGCWDSDRAYSKDAGDNPLPPSFSMSYSGFAHRFDTFVEYRLDGTVEMKGIDVKIQGLGEGAGPLVLYGPPRTPVSHTVQPPRQFKDHVKWQNQYLLPEGDRPSGFKGKTKAMFSSSCFPEYHFDVILSYQPHIYLGQPMVFEIAVRPNESMCTAPISPDITMDMFSVEIRSFTEVRAEKLGPFSCPESRGRETLFRLIGEPDSRTAFSKVNDYTKTIEVKSIVDVPNTFITFNIRRTYAMSVAYHFEGAQKRARFLHEFPVTVHPPLVRSSNSETAVATSSSALPAEPIAALPEYERPPEYHDVLDEQVQDGMQELSLGKGKATAVS